MDKAGRNKKWLKYLPNAALTLLGAAGGYCYYRFVGCSSGTCVITSSPFISTIYGGVIGALLGSFIAPKKWEPDKEEEANE